MKDVKPEQMMPENDVSAEFNEQGLTLKKHVRAFKSEFSAKDTKTIKIKGAIKQEDLPRGFKIVAVSGYISYVKNKDGDNEEIYGDGETIILYKPKALGIRQNARRDLGQHYGVESATETKSQVTVVIKKFSEENGGDSDT